MKIRDHFLEGEGIEQRETPNHSGEIEPHYLVFHFTAGRSASGIQHSLQNSWPPGR